MQRLNLDICSGLTREGIAALRKRYRNRIAYAKEVKILSYEGLGVYKGI